MTPDASGDIPPIVQRLTRPTRVFELSLIGLAVFAVWIPGGYLTLYFCVLIGAALVAEAHLTARMVRLRRHVRAHDYRVCPNCAGALQDNRGPKSCPHCGAPFDAARLAGLWQGPCALGR
jgi:hypothetical protein